LDGVKNHLLASHHGKKRSQLCRGRGGVFAGFYFKKFTMPKTKKQEKLKKKKEATTSMALKEPSSECLEFLVGLIARFYEVKTGMALEMKYV
jgi:hypothetical protein